MSYFNGAVNKVRCIDCVNLSNGKCSAKNVKVSPKKKRLCNQYVFSGEYANREPAEALRVPHVDKKTRRFIKRLQRLGITPVPEKEGGLISSPFRSTATGGVVSVGDRERAPSGDQGTPAEKKSDLLWTPDSDE